MAAPENFGKEKRDEPNGRAPQNRPQSTGNLAIAQRILDNRHGAHGGDGDRRSPKAQEKKEQVIVAFDAHGRRQGEHRPAI